MKKLILGLFLLVTSVSMATEIERAPLVDFGGQYIGLYGFGDYKLVQSSLAGGMIAIPYGADFQLALTKSGELDFANAKYALVAMSRYNAMYGFISLEPDDLKANPFGEAQVRLIPQLVLMTAIVNPARIDKAYREGGKSTGKPLAKYNPDLPCLLFSNLLTSDVEFANKGREIWTNPWQVGIAGSFNIAYDLNNLSATTAIGSFQDAKGAELINLKMGASKMKARLVNRNLMENAIATSQVETTLYPIEIVETLIERPYDPSTDTFSAGGSYKAYLDSVKFFPTLWQTSINYKSKVFRNYAPELEMK